MEATGSNYSDNVYGEIFFVNNGLLYVNDTLDVRSIFFAAHWRKKWQCDGAFSCENQVRLFNIKQNFESFKFERLSHKKPKKKS